MAMEFAHGAVHWLSATAVNGTYTVSGLTFQPKALKFYWNGLASTGNTNATTSTLDLRSGIGFAVSTSSKRCVSTISVDNNSGTNCASMISDNCVVATITAAPATDGVLDLSAINADGFTLKVLDASPVNITVFWEAWGGSDITVATVGDFTQPTTAGTNTDITVTGFDGNSSNDQVVMLALSQSSAALNTASAVTSGYGFGYATASLTEAELVATFGSPPTTNSNTNRNGTIAIATQDNQATSNASRYMMAGSCITSMARGARSVATEGYLTFGTNKFNLAFPNIRDATAKKGMWMAIKGGRWWGQNINVDTRTVSSISNFTNMPFDPIGFSVFGGNDIDISEGGTLFQKLYTLGCGKSTTSRQSLSIYEANNVTTTSVILSLNFDECASYANSTGVVDIAVDVNGISKQNISFIVDAANTTSEYYNNFYVLSFGSTPPVANQEGFRWRNDDGSETTATWIAAQDTDISRNKGTPSRIRILKDTTNNVQTAVANLQFKRSDEASTEWRKV